MWALVTAGDFWLSVGDWLVGRPLAIIAIVVLGLVFRWLMHRLIDRLVRRAEVGILLARLGAALTVDEGGTARRVQRAQTLGSLLKSLTTGVVFAIVVMMVLSEVGIDIGPILASAGIVGVALGFGAQSLVKDYLSGVFMILEDQFGVGDSIDLATVSGTVEAVSLRITRLRDVNGTVWYVRNGEILRLGNQSQLWARSVLDIPVEPGTDLVRARQVLQEVAHDLRTDEDFRGVVLEEAEVVGVQALTHESVTLRLVLKTAPLAQWRVSREMRERIKARFDHEGIALGPTPV